MYKACWYFPKMVIMKEAHWVIAGLPSLSFPWTSPSTVWVFGTILRTQAELFLLKSLPSAWREDSTSSSTRVSLIGDTKPFFSSCWQFPSSSWNHQMTASGKNWAQEQDTLHFCWHQIPRQWTANTLYQWLASSEFNRAWDPLYNKQTKQANKKQVILRDPDSQWNYFYTHFT